MAGLGAITNNVTHFLQNDLERFIKMWLLLGRQRIMILQHPIYIQKKICIENPEYHAKLQNKCFFKELEMKLFI